MISTSPPDLIKYDERSISMTCLCSFEEARVANLIITQTSESRDDQPMELEVQ